MIDPQFEEVANVLVKEDEYTPEPEYGGCYRSPEIILRCSGVFTLVL